MDAFERIDSLIGMEGCTKAAIACAKAWKEANRSVHRFDRRHRARRGVQSWSGAQTPAREAVIGSQIHSQVSYVRGPPQHRRLSNGLPEKDVKRAAPQRAAAHPSAPAAASQRSRLSRSRSLGPPGQRTRPPLARAILLRPRRGRRRLRRVRGAGRPWRRACATQIPLSLPPTRRSAPAIAQVCETTFTIPQRMA